MYRGDQNKSIDNYWFDFSDNNVEYLFYLMRPFVQDMIEEMAQKIQIDIETKLNGRQNDLSGLRKDIEQLIVEAIQTAFHH